MLPVIAMILPNWIAGSGWPTQFWAVAVKAKAAKGPEVVVTNPTVLAIEIVYSHAILPERNFVILDEAHEFVNRTTQDLTEELSAVK